MKSPNADVRARPANAPGPYRCPRCGERLSGPPSAYTCPGPVRMAQPVQQKHEASQSNGIVWRVGAEVCAACKKAGHHVCGHA